MEFYMKINELIQEQLVHEADDDRMAAIRRASQKVKSDDQEDFKELAEILDYGDINRLRGMLRRRARKKGAASNISPETISRLSDAGLVTDQGMPTGKARQFMRWLDDPENDNRTRSMKSKQFRQAADDSLTRGELKRTGTTPTSDDAGQAAKWKAKANKLAQSLSPKGIDNMTKMYNRFLNDRTQNLSKNWGALSEKAKNTLVNLDILDDEGNLTEYGEFALNYIRAFKDDPDGFERVGAEQRSGNRRKDPKKYKRDY